MSYDDGTDESDGGVRCYGCKDLYSDLSALSKCRECEEWFCAACSSVDEVSVVRCGPCWNEERD